MLAFLAGAIATTAGLAQPILAAAAPSSGPPRSLADDDAYLRHGAITTMETCLTVAADARASMLWKGEDYFSDPTGGEQAAAGTGIPPELKNPADHRRLVAWLDRPDSPIRRSKRQGVGTLLACARIVAAWQAALPDAEAASDAMPRHADGRVEHGAIVIDLALGPSAAAAEPTDGDQAELERALIDPVPLVRLLTSPGLLPQAAHGGVIIRNAIITGPLLLNNVHLLLPLSFVNVRFQGGEYSKGVFNSGSIRDRALTIIDSRFQDHFMISDSVFCGDVGILDSMFEQTLELRKIEQYPAGCSSSGDQAEGPRHKITIQTSHFGQDLRISKAQLQHLQLFSNRIESFSSNGTEFGKHLEIANNQIGAFYVDDTLLAAVNAINYNEIATDFAIYGRPLGKSEEERIETLQITSNRIGGGLKLRQLPATRLPRDLVDLRSNRVGNGSSVCLPADWTGELELEGSEFAGVLTIGVPFVDGDVYRGEDARKPCRIAPDGTADAGNLDGLFVGPSAAWIGDRPRREEYCARDTDDRLRVDFKAAEIRTLQWHMPLSCEYRWSGYGLTYDLWLPHPEVEEQLRAGAEGGDGVLAAFRTWRYALVEYQPAPLDAMSRYLDGKGSYVASREIQIEAKRLNYTPNCAPHEWLPACARMRLDSGMTKPASAGSGSADDPAASAPSPMSWIDRVRRGVALFFLMPAGYGAAPENALGWIFGGWIFFSGVYTAYIVSSRRRLDHVKARVTEVVSRLGEQAREQPPGDKLREELEELSGKLAFDELSVEEQCQLLQKTLLPRLRELRKSHRLKDPALVALVEHNPQLGSTDIFGFSRFNPEQSPSRFTPWRYSIDAMIPVIDLHAYNNYYPEARWMRFVPVIQHLLGWWWITVFVASAAIL
jgi:hypothetical protein